MDTYNDHQRIVRSDNIERVIDRHAKRQVNKTAPTRQERDVLAVLDAIYSADPSSYPGLIRLASVFHACTVEQMKLVIHTLRGGTFSEYALYEGVTGAAVGQRWKTVVKKCPILVKVKGGAADDARRILDEGAGKGTR